MSSLDDRVREWRESLERSESLRPEDVDELEQHLMDGFEQFKATGLSEEKAFHLASSRLGNGGALDAEFRKVNIAQVWRLRVSWMLVGYACFVLLGMLIDNLSGGLAGLSAYAGANGRQVGALALGTDLAGWLCVFLGMVRLARRGEGRCVRWLQRMNTARLVLFVGLGAVAGTLIHTFVVRGTAFYFLSWDEYATSISIEPAIVGLLIRPIAMPGICILLALHLLRGARSQGGQAPVWRHRVSWMLVGNASLGILSMLIHGVTSSAVQVAAYAGASIGIGGVLYFVLTLGAWLSIYYWMGRTAAWGGGHCTRYIEGMTRIGLLLFVGALALAGVVVGFMPILVSHSYLTREQRVAAILADFCGALALRPAVPVMCLVAFLYLRRGARSALVD